MSKTFFLLLFFIVFLSLLTPSTIFASNRPDVFNDLWGYAKETRGGLGGKLYTVTRKDDAKEPGTLRYGIESLQGPTWIVFDPQVFPPNTDTPIYLDKYINFRDNITVDGRGSKVSIRKKSYWSDVTWKNNRLWECVKKPNATHDMGGIFKLHSVHNVIITHLIFRNEYVGTPPQPGGTALSLTELNLDCFGDTIGIYNLNGEVNTKTYDNIWINHSEFSYCGDECIGITRSSKLNTSHITLSNNRIGPTTKGVLVGLSDDKAFGINLSMYRNHLINLRMRCPMLTNAILHSYNNIFENWFEYCLGLDMNTRAIIEQNVFIGGSLPTNLWLKLPTAINSEVWLKNNLISGVTDVNQFTNTAFPICSNKTGGSWYYDCSVPTINISALSLEQAHTKIKNYVGWKTTSNDSAQFFPTTSPSPPTGKPGDLNNDGKVDIYDYATLVAGFGTKYTILDYSALLENYNKYVHI